MLCHNFIDPLCPYNHTQFTKLVGNLRRMSFLNWKHKVVENYNTLKVAIISAIPQWQEIGDYSC